MPTHEYVTSVLGYDPETGVFSWKVSNSNRIKVGDRAGVVARNGRRYINVGHEKIMAHRLAWFYVHGHWPSADIKQINGDYDDCSIGNLREQRRSETASNRRVSANSKSGHAGVTWDSRRKKWQVHITRDYKAVGLGYFDDLELAIAARRDAMNGLHSNVTPEERQAKAHAIDRRRRQRTAWKRIPNPAWPSFEDFCADVGHIPETQMKIVAINDTLPVGPGNWRWSLPPEKKYDFKTAEGRAQYGRDHRQNNPRHYRDRELRKKFKIGNEEYDRMVATQGNVCAICKGGENTIRKGRKLHLAVDHDHGTGAIRGILCSGCNKAIGMMCDDIDTLQNAIDYLRRHAAQVEGSPGREE